MRKLNFGEDADGRYKALGVGERTSKKVSRIKMTDGSSFKRRNANQYGDAEGGNEYVETRSNRSDSFDLGGTADSADKGADIGGTLGSSMMKRGGSTSKLKEISLPNSNLYLYGWGRDTNGNSVIKIGFPNRKGFSIQTNGVLPFSNSMKNTSLSDLSKNDIEKIEKEVVNYVTNYGSSNQKSIMKKYNNGGGTKSDYSDTFKQVEDFGNEQYYIRKWGKVGTEKHDNMELLAVAKITDLEDYMSEDELPKEGNFQLSMSLVPIEKYIAKKHKESANDEGSSMGNNTIINVDNYMGGLNYDPQEKVFFKTFEGAEKYLLSKELNDKISAQGMMSGFILDKRYNRAGQTNWDYLGYMTGEKERFANGGGLANVPESFPETDAMSYKKGGGVGKSGLIKISLSNMEDSDFQSLQQICESNDIAFYIDESEMYVITDLEQIKKSNDKDIALDIIGKYDVEKMALGGSTKGFEYSIGGL
jgi:hypothetical protein